MPKITKRTVDALKPTGRDHVVWDDEIRGFGVRVRRSGRKAYIVKYRHRGRTVKVHYWCPWNRDACCRAGQGCRTHYRRQNRDGPFRTR